jgi:uncharacterized membrane-anchored protein YhcB (DUF1043 family)
MVLLTMTFGKFLLALLGLGVVAIILGAIILGFSGRGVAQENFWISYDKVKKAIYQQELNLENYNRIDAMFDNLYRERYVHKKAYKALWHDFQDKFRDYSPYVVK